MFEVQDITRMGHNFMLVVSFNNEAFPINDAVFIATSTTQNVVLLPTKEPDTKDAGHNVAEKLNVVMDQKIINVGAINMVEQHCDSVRLL